MERGIGRVEDTYRVDAEPLAWAWRMRCITYALRVGISTGMSQMLPTHPLWARAWRGVHGCLCGEEAGDESLLLSFVDEVQDDLSLP